MSLSDDDIKLLCLGLKFAPTPKWDQSTRDKEWKNLFQHVRKVEWADYFRDEERDEHAELTTIRSRKLKTPNFSRPQSQLLSEETRTYVEMVTNKLRNLKFDVKNCFERKNNLSKKLRLSLKSLKSG